MLTCSSRAATLALFDFNSQPLDANLTTGSLQPLVGSGTARLVGGVTGSFTGSSDPSADNSNWRVTTWPLQGTGNKLHGIEFRVSTAGASNLVLHWDQRNSNTASKYTRLQYSTNGTSFVDYQVIVMPPESWINRQGASFIGVPGADNNPLFAVRFVIEFESTATGSGANSYAPANATSSYGSAGTLRFDQVEFLTQPTPQTFSVLSYNIYGGGFEDTPENWSTNAPRIQALGRVLQHLKPDIVGFQEVTVSNTWQLTNLMNAYLPGYYLATNGTTAGGPMNAFASRFPVLRSQSWLARVPLDAFGFDGVFTRDLYEAEIAVPGLSTPLHVFNVHLKAFADATNSVRRAAEACCISNWFVNVFLAGPSRTHPYVLVGDMNEDAERPRAYEQDAMGTLTSSPVDLKMTRPANPVTLSERTWNSTSPTIRFDYVLPSGSLHSNLAGGLVFRSDQSNASNPLPPGMPVDTTRVAADHLPVVLQFNIPGAPFTITSVKFDGTNVILRWLSQVNACYSVDASLDLVTWTTLATDILSTSTNHSWTGTNPGSRQSFRVRRQ